MKISKKILSYFISDSIAPEEKFFNLMTAGAIMAAGINCIMTIFADMPYIYWLVIGASGVVMLVSALAANRTKKFYQYSFELCMTVCGVLLPMTYFTGGGMHSGIFSWFSLGIIFIFIMLRGKHALITAVAVAVIDVACVLTEYFFPEAVFHIASEKMIVGDLLMSFIVSSIVIGMVVKSQRILLEKENLKVRAQYEHIGKLNKELRGSLEIKTDQIKCMQRKIIESFANIVEHRDGDTGGHVKRTSEYVRIIATELMAMGLFPDIISPEYVDIITAAAPLHDIGKINITDTILNKPGRLTPEEFDIMKTHAREGYEIITQNLTGIESDYYVEVASNLARYHHERWDGKGYPEGKKGGTIPLSARIMAVSDVFDALVSKRCYKDAMTFDDAFEIIKNESGTHFDPRITDAFFHKKEEIIKTAHAIGIE